VKGIVTRQAIFVVRVVSVKKIPQRREDANTTNLAPGEYTGGSVWIAHKMLPAVYSWQAKWIIFKALPGFKWVVGLG
jgi:hypothetical protein